ncbi:MAG: M48 family metallopeptidase [Proteobacteria bacterium]|jgi:STE24 endopeptidase|nr:M48 family metallopeptidase [Pseudomonadota bacterium]
MDWNGYTAAFAAALLAHRATELALDAAQLRHLARRRDRVPAHLEGEIDLETVRRAARYAAEKIRFGMIARCFDCAVLCLFVASGFEALDRAAALLAPPGVPRGLAFFAGLGLALFAARLPFDAWATFAIEARHGFNRQRPAGFIADKAKELAMGAALGGALLAIVLLLAVAFPRAFPLAAFACVAAFQLLLAWFYPVAILPLFNRLVPVGGALAEEIGALAGRIGFPLRGVVSMDGSRRSVHVNAFIVGLVGARRVVLYDTLVEKLGRPELLAVVAHELGHFSLGHVRLRLGLALGALAATFAALGAVYADPGLALGMGFAAWSPHAALAGFSLIAAEASFPFGWLGRVASRRLERAADAFAVRAAGGAELKGALLALHKQNLASPGSARAYRAYYNTHPTLKERLAAIRVLAGEGACRDRGDLDPTSTSPGRSTSR